MIGRYCTIDLFDCYIWQIRSDTSTIVANECTVDIWYNGANTEHITIDVNDCVIGTLTANAYVTLTSSNCTIGYFGMNGYAEAIFTNCDFGQFMPIGYAQAELIGNFSYSYLLIQENAVITRTFSMLIQFSNGTPAAFVEFSVLDDANQTITSGITNSLGEASFSLVFDLLNRYDFDDPYHVEVNIITHYGYSSFDTVSSQPMIVVLSESSESGGPLGMPLVLDSASMNQVSNMSMTLIMIFAQLSLVLLSRTHHLRREHLK